MGSITHLEDLSTPDFLDTLESLSTKQATEKLDGANLYFGIDKETDQLFTSREGKRSTAKRVFNPDDYPYYSGTNPFRAAHIALQNEEEKIRKVMTAGQTVEIEVLFGRQPNAITYGADNKSFIAFLQGVNGTPAQVVDDLTHALVGVTTKVVTKVVASEDGANIDLKEQETTFEFIGPQNVSMTEIVGNAELQAKIAEFNAFLNETAKGLPDSMTGTTNGELDQMSMSSVKVVDRDQVKDVKAKLQSEILTKFKLPIKKILVGEVAKHKSKLAAEDIKDGEDIGIEGIVLRDPTTGDLVKIVDKAAFTAINSFNHTVRGQISGTVKTISDDAPLENRGGVVGHMKIQIAKALGMPELARAGQARKILADMEEETPQATLQAFANTLDISDYQAKKGFVQSIIKQALKDLESLRSEFVENKDEYSLKMANGKTIGISPEVVKRTLLSFAEAQVDLVELLEKIKGAKELEDLLDVLYGFAVPKNKADSPEVMAEAKKATKKPAKKTPARSSGYRIDNDPARFVGKDAWEIINSYMATVLMSTLMYKQADKIGMRLLMDKSNFRMLGLNPAMSPVNFWGYPVWKSGTGAVKKLIGAKAANELNKVIRRIPPAWFKFLHMDLSSGKQVPINWGDHFKTMSMLQQFPGMKFDRISFLLKGIFGFENLTYDQKVKVLNALHLYVAQFLPNSPLFVRLKTIQRGLLFNPNELDSIMTLSELAKPVVITGVHTLSETAEAGAAVAADVAPLPKNILSRNTNANVVKRKRNTDIKHIAFKKPENSAV